MAVIQTRNSEMIQLLTGEFQRRNEPQFALANTISTFLAIPGLVGFWPMSPFDPSNGDTFDVSGATRTLTNNSNVTFGFDDLAPYSQYDGVGANRLIRLDEAALDITGTEADIENNGLTIGCWVFLDTGAVGEQFIGKWGAAGSRSYRLDKSGGGNIRILISSDGTAQTTIAASNAPNTSDWNFAVGRFDPSTELAIFLNGTKTTNTTSIPASIFQSATDFSTGATGAGANPFDGKLSMCFLSASFISDVAINNLYQQTRTLFGV